jgi:hypothetical protein
VLHTARDRVSDSDFTAHPLDALVRKENAL